MDAGIVVGICAAGAAAATWLFQLSVRKWGPWYERPLTEFYLAQHGVLPIDMGQLAEAMP